MFLNTFAIQFNHILNVHQLDNPDGTDASGAIPNCSVMRGWQHCEQSYCQFCVVRLTCGILNDKGTSLIRNVNSDEDPFSFIMLRRDRAF